MSFSTVPDKATGDTFTEALWDTYIKDNLNSGVLRPIAESVLSGAAASIDFTSIAATYRHLLLQLSGRGDTAAALVNVLLRFNNDSAANYDDQFLGASGTTVSGNETPATASPRIATISAASATAGAGGSAVIHIPDYAGTTLRKRAISDYLYKTTDGAGGLSRGAFGIEWRSTAAITRVTLLPAGGNFAAGTVATLYGVPS